jgi:hypothetical protein
MKQMTKFFALATVMLAFAVTAFSQVSATATATATILTPLSIVNAGDMNFGSMASTAGGTVVLLPASTTTATGVKLLGGTITAAHFTVGGEGTSVITIAIPTAVTTVASLGGQTMTIDTWTSNPATAAGVGTAPLVAGALTIDVGATLHVAAGQAAGVYSTENPGGTGPFTVTVNYQ